MDNLNLVRRVTTIVLALLLLAATRVEADSVTIAWDPNPEPDIAGYTVSWGTQSGVYTFSQNVVGATSLVVSNLQSGTTYYFVVQAYNTAGLKSAYSQEVSTLVGGVPAAPQVVSLAASASAPFVQGVGVTFTATATGGVAPLQYQFWLYQAGTGWTVLRDWGTSNRATWTPLVAGSYALQVWVRNAGSTSNYDAWRSYGLFDVKAAPLAVTGLTTATVFPVTAGTPVTWTATATGGVAPLQYQFWLYQAGGKGWTALRDWGVANQVTWTPTEAGSYSLQVWVRNAGSTANYDAWRSYGQFNVTVAPVTVTALTTATASPVALQTPVTFAATATGGTPPLEYEFWLYRAQGGGWTVLRGYGPQASVTWTPTEVGTYTLQVWARSTGSTALYEAWRSSDDVVVVDTRPHLTGLTPQPALPVPPHVPVTFTATATGGVAPLEYQFWLYQAGGTGWTLLRDYATSNQVTWTPEAVGLYSLQAWLRSAGSTAVWEDWKGLGPFSVTDALTVTNFSANVSPPVTVGTPVTLTAATAGGLAPIEYSFWLLDATTNTWSLLQGYSVADHVVWTPAKAGVYRMQVWVRSAGSTANYDAWQALEPFTVVTQPPVVTALTPSVSPPLAVGVPMTWTATATGGVAPLAYQFWLYQAGGKGWTLLQDYSASNQVSWTPAAAGDYVVQVWVRGAASTASYDAWLGSGVFQVR